MKKFYLLLVLTFIGCHKKDETSSAYKVGDLTFLKKYTMSTGLISVNDALKFESTDFSNGNKKLKENLLKESYLNGDILILENFQSNTLSEKAYFLDKDKTIVLFYNQDEYGFVDFKLQRNNEDFETSERFSKEINGIIIKDLDEDGIKEVIVLSTFKINLSNDRFYDLDIFSVVN